MTKKAEFWTMKYVFFRKRILYIQGFILVVSTVSTLKNFFHRIHTFFKKLGAEEILYLVEIRVGMRFRMNLSKTLK